jgi:hypothetical protein
VTSPNELSSACEQTIGSYLAEIDARLAGPARARRDIMTELGAGLADAADAHRSAGLNMAQAARAAIAEFGSPDQVAVGFRAELAAAQARRTALALMATGPLAGVLWIVAALTSHIGAQPAPPWEWVGLPTGARLATHVAMPVLAATIGSSLFTVATTGRLTRWLPARPAASAAIAASGLVVVDVAMLAALAILAASMPGRLAPLPVAAAGAASLTRLSLVSRAARNLLTIRAASPPVAG